MTQKIVFPKVLHEFHVVFTTHVNQKFVAIHDGNPSPTLSDRTDFVHNRAQYSIYCRIQAESRKRMDEQVILGPKTAQSSSENF